MSGQITAPSYVIIPLSIDDAALLSKLAQRIYPQHYAYLWHDGGAWYAQTSFNETQLRAELSDTNNRFFVAYDEAGVPLGFMKIKLHYPLSKGAGFAFGFGEGSHVEVSEALYLDRLYLLAEATGRGLGKKMTDLCVDLAQQLGKKAVWLVSMDTSPAVQFYEKNGFHICGTWQLDFENVKPGCRGILIMYREVG